MLCGVTATLGSNPSATATAARPQWGRAVLLCLPDLWARSLGVPVGGGPPARSPHASLKARSGRSRGPPWPCRHPPAPRPGPAADHGYRSQARASKHARALHACHTNFACNSLVTISNVEFIALKSQRFQTLLNLHPIELHASFWGSGHIDTCW